MSYENKRYYISRLYPQLSTFETGGATLLETANRPTLIGDLATRVCGLGTRSAVCK